MHTRLGRFLKILRINHDQILKDMAELLGVSPAFLSAVENGKKNMPESWKKQLRTIYALNAEQCEELELAVLESKKQVVLDIEGTAEPRRQLAISFARSFKDMDDKTTERLLKIIQESQGDTHGK